VLASTSDIAITGNLFSGLSTKAVALEGNQAKDKVQFSGNLLVDVESDIK
jgi:hypothetical protein